MKLKAVLAWSLLVVLPTIAVAQQQPGAIAPAEPLKDGQWEEIDKRFLFLMVRLANLEASLDAVNNAIGKATGQRTASTAVAKRAEAGNELMDRKAGGPMKWSEFYGTNAEKFFYHPVDPNTSYHTRTVLRQNGPAADNKVGGGVPASQGLPVQQRPPQFDYIYRANDNAKARAEQDAAELKGKIDALFERRQRLEAEQNGLWCEIAFRAVARFDLARKPVYRFEPLLAEGDSESRRHAEAMKAASGFMMLAISIVDEAQKDQPRALSAIKAAVSEARKKLDDAWLRQAVDSSDMQTTTGKFFALAKRLDDVAANLSDSYSVAAEGDQAKDQQRKDTFRAMLQESLVNYAQIILALDEMSGLMAKEWMFKPDVDKPIQVASLPAATPLAPVRSPEPPVTSPGVPSPSTSPSVPTQASVAGLQTLLDNKSILGWKHDNGTPATWMRVDGEVFANKSKSHIYYMTQQFSDFDLQLYFKCDKVGDGGVFVRCQPSSKPEEFPSTGYEIQAGHSNPKHPTGTIFKMGDTRAKREDAYAESGLAVAGQWTLLRIVTKDNRITVYVNGKMANDFQDATTPYPSGYIALQSNGGGVRYRDIKIKAVK